jgi:ABC-type phosphate/phosphonate transport system substrate-binding protein
MDTGLGRKAAGPHALDPRRLFKITKLIQAFPAFSTFNPMRLRPFKTSIPLIGALPILIITLLVVRPSGSPAIAQRGERFGAGGREASLPTTPPLPAPLEEPPLSFRLSEIFRIGYLATGSDLTPARPLLHDLREALMANEAFMTALAEKGYREISLRPSDEPSDMIQQLQTGDIELAFATPIVYARHFGAAGDQTVLERQGFYEPILQFERPGDVRNTRGEGVMRQAAVFISRGSPLWGTRPTEDQIRQAINSSTLAVSDSNSAASYIYPRIKAFERFDGARPASFLFCGSNAEVVKYVLSGLAEIGACEMQTLKTLGTINTESRSGELFQILFTTDVMPTDPILMRVDLAPRASASPLGTELKAALRSFFNSAASKHAQGLKVANASRQAYEPVARALESFDRLTQPGGGVAPPAFSGDAGTTSTLTPPREERRPALPPEMAAPKPSEPQGENP